MADSKFKLDKVFGNGTDSIKIAPIESTNQNSYSETYQIKVNNKVISEVDLKLLKVPKDKYVPTSDDGLVYVAPRIGFFTGDEIRSLEYLYNSKDPLNKTTVPYTKPIRVLHTIFSNDTNYLNKVGNLIYVWEYRTNKWLSLSSVRKKLDIGPYEDFILNTAYYGAIMIDFNVTDFTLPDTLLKDDTTKCYVKMSGRVYIYWPNRYTQNGNSTDKPYHIKITLKDNTPIGKYIGGYVDCKYTKISDTGIEGQYERDDKKRIFYKLSDTSEEKKYINTLYTCYSNAHVNISLIEENNQHFDFHIKTENFYYHPTRIKVGDKIYHPDVSEMVRNNGTIEGIVLKGIDEYTIPKIPFEIGFKDGYFGRYSGGLEENPEDTVVPSLGD